MKSTETCNVLLDDSLPFLTGRQQMSTISRAKREALKEFKIRQQYQQMFPNNKSKGHMKTTSYLP